MPPPTLEAISFGGGCFWGVQHAFKQIPGVAQSVCGYQGGSTPNPTYREVCAGDSGHIEVVQVHFDPGRLPLSTLLRAFWLIHDPTQKNRQGPDIGRQYQSAIFCRSDDHVELACKSRSEEAGKHTLELTTLVAIDTDFYPAEREHQDYLENHPAGYCHIDASIFARLRTQDF